MGMRVVVPLIGWSEAATLREWHREDGDWVNPGSAICTLQMGSRSYPLLAVDSGFFQVGPRVVKAGAPVSRGDVLGFIVVPGESAESFAKGIPSRPLRVIRLAERVRRWLDAAMQANPKRPRMSPRARRIARESGISWESLQGTGGGGRVVARDVEAAARLRPAAGNVERPWISASITARLPDDDLRAQQAIDEWVVRAVELLRPHCRRLGIRIGLVGGEGLLTTNWRAVEPFTSAALGEMRMRVPERTKDAPAEWMVIDAASAGLESLLLPLPANYHGCINIGRSSSTARISYTADARRLDANSVVKLLQTLVAGE